MFPIAVVLILSCVCCFLFLLCLGTPSEWLLCRLIRDIGKSSLLELLVFETFNPLQFVVKVVLLFVVVVV